MRTFQKESGVDKLKEKIIYDFNIYIVYKHSYYLMYIILDIILNIDITNNIEQN